MGKRPTVYITYSLIIQGSFLQRQLNMDTAEWFLHMPRLTSWQLAQRGLVAPVLCDCWQRWIANHIVDSYPVTKFDCALMRLHWRCGWRCGQLAKKHGGDSTRQMKWIIVYILITDCVVATTDVQIAPWVVTRRGERKFRPQQLRNFLTDHSETQT